MSTIARSSAFILSLLASSLGTAAQVDVTSISSSAHTSYKSDNQGSPIDLPDMDLDRLAPLNAFSDLGSQPDVPGTATAFQGANGSDAVSVQGAFANGATFNTIAATAKYSFAGVLAGDPGQNYQVFLGYSVLPGRVGLKRLLRADPLNPPSEAEISFTVEALGLNPDPQSARGAFGQLILNGGLNVTSDGGFAPGNPTLGTETIDGFNYDTVRTAAFSGLASLGHYVAGDMIAFNYILEAHVTQPGFEIFSIAGVGDPLTLQVSPDGPFQFEFRLVPTDTTNVPEPGGALLMGLVLIGLSATHRLGQRAK